MSEKVSRRKYIAVAGAAAAAAVIGGTAYYLSQPSPLAPTPTPSPTPKPTPTATPKPTSTPAALVEVSLAYSGWGSDTMNNIVSDFTEKNPHIKVNIFTMAGGKPYHDKMVTMFTAGKGYDIVYGGFMEEFADAGWIIPIDDRVSDRILNDLHPVSKQCMMYKDHMWGLPWYLNLGLGFNYNKEMLSKAGIDEPPTTWSELREQCLKIKEKGIVEYPLGFSAMQDPDAWTVYEALLHSYGLTFFDEDGNCILNSPEHVEVLQMMIDWIHKDKIVHPTCMEVEMHGVTELMAGGEVAFTLNGYYYLKTTNDPEKSKVAGKVYAAPFPGSDDRPAKGGGLSSSVGWYVTKFSEHKDEAYSFVEWLGGPEGHKRWWMEKMLFPSYKSLASDPEVLNAFPEAKGYFEHMEYLDFANDKLFRGPIVRFRADYDDLTSVEISKAITQTVTPKEALDAIVEKVKELQQRYK